MYTKKVVALAAMAAFADQAVAFNSHRHMHQQAKRALETDLVTVWETVYVTAGQVPAPTNKPADEVVEPAQEPAQQPPAPLPVTSTVTSIVQPAPTQEKVPAPAPVATTLASIVKQNPAPTTKVPEPADEPEESIAPVLNPVKATSTQPNQPESTDANTNGGKSLTKRGIAYNDPALANAFGSACEKCSWAYNWGSLPGDLDTNKFEFMPTLWGDIDIHTSHWDSDVEQCLASGTEVLFSFNEPDHATQANMSPEQAAAAHNQWMNKYAGRAQVCAPSVTNSGNPGEGLEWLRSFHDACNNIEGGCQIDCCNIHWYSEAAYSDTLFTHIEGAKEICGGKPIYLTEFAPLGSDEDKNSFMTNVISALDDADGLAGYSYFMVAEGNLMSSLTDLSSYGQLYASI